MSDVRSGDELFEAGAVEPVYVVTETGLPHARVRLLHLADDQEMVIKLAEVRAYIGAGQWTLRRPGAPRVLPVFQHDFRLDETTANALAQVDRLQGYSERYGLSINQSYQALRKADRRDEEPGLPSRSTAYRYLRSKRNGLPVLCGDANKGNRTARYGDKVTDLVTKLAKDLHQQPGSRWTVKSLTQHCNLEAQAGGLIPPGTTMSSKFVKTVIFTHVNADAELYRILPHLRAAQKAIAKHRIRVHGFLQRVEQDALHLPWRITTLAGELHNIYLVHAIDVGTSIPVGWRLVVGAPTTEASLACCESIFFSKKQRLAELGVKVNDDFYGTPTCMVFDNGPEANNKRMNALGRLGIGVQYCRSRHPHHKPFIERLNRALKEALETLPGCTRMDGKDGSRDPSLLNDLPMSLEEIERWIVRWYFEDWALRPLKSLVRGNFSDAEDLGATPLARFQHLERAGYAMPLPPNVDDWKRVKLQAQQRTLSRKTGISIDGFQFRGSELERLITRYGETSVEVLVDPDDFRTVEVVDENQLVVLVNADVDESTPVLSFATAKAKAKAAVDTALAAGKAVTEQFRKDVFAASLPREKRLPKRSGRKTANNAAGHFKHAKAVNSARSKPLPPSPSHVESAVSDDSSLDQVPSLRVVNRQTGEVL